MPSYSSNYSKWDALEVSDDSDIEGHPNVDHRSLVMWKQRDIHEKRELRKMRIADYEATIKTNSVLIPRLRTIAKDLVSGGPPYFNQLVNRLQEQPSPEAPLHSPDHSYDSMVLSLLNKVYDEVIKEKGVDKKDTEKLGKELQKHFQDHLDKLVKVDADAQTGLKEELEEQKKHITSDDIREGWDSKYVPPKAEPKPTSVLAPKKKSSKKPETVIETLNPPSPSASIPTPSKSSTSNPTPNATADSETEDDSDDEGGIPRMTPELIAFSKLPVGDFEASFAFLQASTANKNIIFTEGAVDALLLEAFTSEMSGKRKYAKQCVHQSLLVQYCEKLGKDGIGMFFKKMIGGNKQALAVFENDVEQTYATVKKRAKINAEEQAKIREQGGVEQIQLVAENPSTIISFDVPDGPPPADLRLEPSPETEGMDIEEVRTALQSRWDIFQGFDPKFQKALKSNSLEQVNKVLGKMSIEEAENVVELLQMAGILNFAEGGIRDETGKGPQS